MLGSLNHLKDSEIVREMKALRPKITIGSMRMHRQELRKAGIIEAVKKRGGIRPFQERSDIECMQCERTFKPKRGKDNRICPLCTEKINRAA